MSPLGNAAHAPGEIDGVNFGRSAAMIEKTFGKSVATATLMVLITLSGSLGAAAETDVYRDALQPGGHARSAAQKRAAFAACGYSGSPVDDSAFQRIDQCLNARGWTIDHIVPDAPQNAHGNNGPATRAVTYNKDSPNPAIGWHSEGGWRVCHNDCDNPEIPGSGFTCKTVQMLGTAVRDCSRTN
jgi:hypothetical protein